MPKKEYKQNIGWINSYPERGIWLFTSLNRTKCLIIPSDKPYKKSLISSLFNIVF